MSAYFDEYIEDIVYVFDTVAPKYVIFVDESGRVVRRVTLLQR